MGQFSVTGSNSACLYVCISVYSLDIVFVFSLYEMKIEYSI